MPVKALLIRRIYAREFIDKPLISPFTFTSKGKMGDHKKHLPESTITSGRCVQEFTSMMLTTDESLLCG
jgi:hypothetical protein